MGVGALCGFINGVMVVGLRMHPLIVTLGTMSIFRGIAIVTTATKTLPEGSKEIPSALTVGFMKYDFGHLPIIGKSFSWLSGLALMPIVTMVVVTIIGTVFLQLMVAGRETYAVGGNAEAARF